MRNPTIRRETLPALEDLARLERAAAETGTRNRVLVRLLIRSGLRRFEAAALNVEDLHLEGEPPYLVVRNGKGGKVREIPLDGEIAGDLRVLVGLRRNGPVFRSRKGGRNLTGGQVERIVRRTAEAAGLDGIHAHALRHAYATYHLAAGTPLHAVQQFLGHSSIKTTQVYLHVLETMRGEYVEGLRVMLNGGQNPTDRVVPVEGTRHRRSE